MTKYTSVSGIYIILNTKNGKVYIGQAQDFKVRWRDHKWKLRINKHGNPHLQAAWNKYGENVFKFQKLEYCSIEDLDEREQHYLDIYMSKGVCYNIAQLANKPPMTGRHHTPETRKKISLATTGIKRDDEFRKKRSDIMKNSPPTSADTRKKLSDAAKGRKLSDETKRKISESLKKLPPISEETRQKLRDGSKKRPPISEETRKKLSESNKGKVRTAEQNKRQREIQLGKKHTAFSDAHKQKISESMRLSWERKRAEEENKNTE